MKPILSEILKINDSKQRIALGFGLGVLSGIFPGTGPLVAVFLAVILRANYFSALLGSLLTNTWLSIVTFLLAIKVGAVIMMVNWHDAQKQWFIFLEHFQWSSLIKISALKLVVPVLIGYLVIAFLAGLLAYLLILIILGLKNKEPALRSKKDEIGKE